MILLLFGAGILLEGLTGYRKNDYANKLYLHTYPATLGFAWVLARGLDAGRCGLLGHPPDRDEAGRRGHRPIRRSRRRHSGRAGDVSPPGTRHRPAQFRARRYSPRSGSLQPASAERTDGGLFARYTPASSHGPRFCKSCHRTPTPVGSMWTARKSSSTPARIKTRPTDDTIGHAP